MATNALNRYGQATAGLVQAPAPVTELQVVHQALDALQANALITRDQLDAVLNELKPITELFESLARNPMLKQFLA